MKKVLWSLKQFLQVFFKIFVITCESKKLVKNNGIYFIYENNHLKIEVQYH